MKLQELLITERNRNTNNSSICNSSSSSKNASKNNTNSNNNNLPSPSVQTKSVWSTPSLTSFTSSSLSSANNNNNIHEITKKLEYLNIIFDHLDKISQFIRVTIYELIMNEVEIFILKNLHRLNKVCFCFISYLLFLGGTRNIIFLCMYVFSM